MDTNITPSSFWKRPEGKAGYLLIALLAVPAAMLLNVILPIINLAMVNLYVAIGLGVGLFLTYRILTSNVTWYLFKMMSRWMAQLVVDLDPVSIMQSFLSFAVEQRGKLVDAISEVQGAQRTLNAQVATYDKEIKNYQSMAEAGLRKHSNAGTNGEEDLEVNAALENAGALKRARDEFFDMAKDLDGGIADLIEALKRVDYEISTTRTQVNVEKERAKVTKAVASANDKISAVLEGGAKREMYDAATDRIRSQYNEKRAKLEILVETSRAAAGSIDLSKRALRNEGLAELKKQLGQMTGQGLLTSGTAQAPMQVKATIADEALSDFISKK